MSLMLLTASFLMTRGFHSSVARGHRIREGSSADGEVRSAARAVRPRHRRQQFYKLLVERARTTPGVQSAGLTQNPPLGLGAFDRLAFVPDGFQMPRDRENFTAMMDTVDEGFFETMGIPILRGRGFLASDTADAPRVAVVNEQFARHYWPNADAVGQHIRLDSRTGAPVEIVGVAQTIKYRQTLRKADGFRLPAAGAASGRANGPAAAIERRSAAADRAREGRRPGARREPADARRREPTRTSTATPPSKGLASRIELVGTMGAVGLLLAIAGLYGLVAYNVSRRTREIGIRMAIGAGPADVLRLVMGKGLVLVGDRNGDRARAWAWRSSGS